jgi:hypothetical protein
MRKPASALYVADLSASDGRVIRAKLLLMNLQQFQESTNANQPPTELPLVLAALWWDFKGDWEKAHECAQQRESTDHAWVHAYLHREEGDLDNAGYWYRRAGREVFTGSLEDERREIAEALLGK